MYNENMCKVDDDEGLYKMCVCVCVRAQAEITREKRELVCKI